MSERISDRLGGRMRLSPLLAHRDLIAAALYVLATAAVFFLPIPILRAVIVIPLVLLVPGYALVSALFPALVVPTVERLLMSVGASLALVIGIGLALAFSGLGLTPVNWLLALSFASLLLLGVAALRRDANGITPPAFRVAPMSRLGALAVVGAVLIVANVLVGSRLIAGDQQANPPLQLWMVPVPGDDLAAEIGVHADDAGGRYTVIVSSAGAVVADYDIVVPAQETWTTVVEFTPDVRSRPIVARLYEAGETVEARFVVLQPITRAS